MASPGCGPHNHLLPGTTIPKSLFLPNVTITVDTFAKSLYSLLLSDFRVVDKTNALLTHSGTEWLQSQVDEDLKERFGG